MTQTCVPSKNNAYSNKKETFAEANKEWRLWSWLIFLCHELKPFHIQWKFINEIMNSYTNICFVFFTGKEVILYILFKAEKVSKNDFNRNLISFCWSMYGGFYSEQSF